MNDERQYRVISVQWIDVTASSSEEAVTRAGEEYYSLDYESRESLPSVAVALDMLEIEEALVVALETVGRVIDSEEEQ